MRFPSDQQESAVPRHTTTHDDEPPDDGEDDYGTAEEDYDPEADWSPDDEFLPGEAAEIPCPHCGAAITEDHHRCPKCAIAPSMLYAWASVTSSANRSFLVRLGISPGCTSR